MWERHMSPLDTDIGLRYVSCSPVIHQDGLRLCKSTTFVCLQIKSRVIEDTAAVWNKGVQSRSPHCIEHGTKAIHALSDSESRPPSSVHKCMLSYRTQHRQPQHLARSPLERTCSGQSQSWPSAGSRRLLPAAPRASRLPRAMFQPQSA